MREPNTPIGTCPCPTKGCEQVVTVYRYRQRNESPGRARHAGKLYVVCRDHGRLDPQEYILEHATIDRTAAPPEPAKPAVVAAAKTAPRPAAEISAPRPTSSSTTPVRGSFGFYE